MYFKSLVYSAAVVTFSSFSQAIAADLSSLYRSVFRIEVATQIPDYQTPWNSGHFSGGVGTGFLIGKNRILTNAHVVSNHQRILITVHGSPRKYPAKLQFIAHDCDLALLSLEDDSDFEKLPHFQIGEMPALESQVSALGYPIGGERLSVTQGIVSRIDFQSYSHSRADAHLVVQIDAAINPGNSGGPVVQNGKVVGVAFQGLTQADNTGYIIPTPVVNRFLKDIEDGTYDQYAELGIHNFPLHNPAMRKSLGLPDDGQGVLITNVIAKSSADGFLQNGDVLLSLDGHMVDSDGKILLDGEKVNLNEVIERKFRGDKVAVRFLRDGSWNDVEIILKNLPESRMYAIQYDKKPRYLVFAGLVFQPLDTNLFATSKFDDITVRRLYSDYVSKGIFQTKEDIVMLTRVLPDPITTDLESFSGRAVKTINDVKVRNLAHAYELMYETKQDTFHSIELYGASRPLIIPAEAVEESNQRIQRNYGISKLSNLKD